MRLIHVAVGVIIGADGKILIARRADDAHQGGLWEFPGGKVEPEESVLQALARELLEELAITIHASEPLIKIRHDYGDKSVLLDVHKINLFSGEPQGNEGQPVRWVSPGDLQDYEFPAANRPIITAINLPQRLLITGDIASTQDCLNRVEKAIAKGIRLVQLRMKKPTTPEFLELAKTLAQVCNDHSVSVLINTTVEYFNNHCAELPGAGLYLNSHELMEATTRPVTEKYLLGASCHNENEIIHAQNIGIDFICLSPVAKTTSHPDGETLGWARFIQLTEKAVVPVFALGGMVENDLPSAIAAGAQGIAAISAWWD